MIENLIPHRKDRASNVSMTQPLEIWDSMRKFLFLETEEMMEMDSPFHQVAGASIEGGSSQILKRGHSITLTCRVFGIMSESGSRKAIEWMKNGESLSLKVAKFFIFE